MECNGQDTLFVILNNPNPCDCTCTQCTLDSGFNVEPHELLKNDHANVCYSDSFYSHFTSTMPLKGQWLPNPWLNPPVMASCFPVWTKTVLVQPVFRLDLWLLIFCYQQPKGIKAF